MASINGKKPAWGILQFMGVSACFVGLQMYWTFPRFIFEKSAAGFIPFYVGMFIIVLPVIYVQMRLGGSTHSNMVSIFSKYVPILKGVGVANMIRLFLLAIVYNVFVSYTIYYAAYSLTQPYPWNSCNSTWNTQKCDSNTSSFSSDAIPAEAEFFQNDMLMLSDEIASEGTLPWKLLLCLLGSWLFTFICMCGGIRWFGWVMFLLGSVGVTLTVALLAYGREEIHHGSPEYNIYSADWNKITVPSAVEAFIGPWLQGIYAAVLMARAWDGLLPTLGKYSGRGRLVTNSRWVFLFVALCILPHLFIFMISCYMNALATVLGVDLRVTLTEGHSLLFINFPAVFHHLEIKRGVAFLFYMTMGIFTVQGGALSSIVAVDNIVDGVKHIVVVGKCGCKKPGWFLLTAGLFCFAGFILSIPMVTQGGLYVVMLVMGWIDKLMCVVVFFSFIAFTISYAKQRYHLANRIAFSIWFVLSGLFTVLLYIYKGGVLREYKSFSRGIKYGQTFEYPPWAVVLGWFIAGGFVVVGLLFGAMHAIGAADGSGCEYFLVLHEKPAVAGPVPATADYRCTNACAGRTGASRPVSRSASKNKKNGDVSEDEGGYLQPDANH